MSLTSLQQGEELKRARSFAYWLKRYLWVRTDGGTKFDPWPWQYQLAQGLPHHQRVVILKARQLGMSWELGAGYALHTAMYHPGADVLLISQTEDDARELLVKLKFSFEKLPEWMRPAIGKDNTEVLEFPRLHSQIRALPSTKKAGRGFTGKLVLTDEHAQHAWGEENFAAIDPAIEQGGQFISLSSASGIDNQFADLCAKATERVEWQIPTRIDGALRFRRELRDVVVPPGGWLPIFLPYDARPGRTPEWWEEKQAGYTRAWMVHQEYPRDPTEAFVQTGRPVFGKACLDLHKELYRDPLPQSAWPKEFAAFRPEELRIWALPVEGHRYAGGGDVAEGLEFGDFSDLSVLDVDAGDRPVEVLTLHGHWPPDRFAALIDVVARVYPGVYGIERNNHGHAVVLECRRLGTPGLYAEKAVLDRLGKPITPGKLGWLTNTTTKPVMIDDLERALREFSIELRDANAHPELVFYQTYDDGATGAPSGKHDDRVMSRAIAVQMIKRGRQRYRSVARAGRERPA
jgi:hypothetical protein